MQWVWPSEESYGERHQALIAFTAGLVPAWSGFQVRGHALEVGHAFQLQLPSILEEFRRGSLPVPLLAARVCSSPFDLALHDAFGRLCGRPVYETYDAGYLNADLSRFLEPEPGVDFSGLYPRDFLAPGPLRRLPAWHLVGGLDPLTPDELTGDEPDDGHPVLLADWIRRDGLKCLKVKLRGTDEAWDYGRLVRVGAIGVEHGVDWLSADFNCTVTEPGYVNGILDRLRDEHPRLYGMVLYVEQPFPYDLEAHSIDVHAVSARKPLFMDESAHDWKLVRLGRSLGWNGVALKTCKTQTEALLSLCWARAHGMGLMVQDLTNPMLAQIPHVLLAAHADTIMGVETNSMQFYPEASAAEAQVHPGLYSRRGGRPGPRLARGDRLRIPGRRDRAGAAAAGRRRRQPGGVVMVPVSLHEAVLSVRRRPVRFPVPLGGGGLELDELHLTLELSTAGGRRSRGVAADVLAPAWFDPLLPTGVRALAAGARTAADVAVASARVPRPAYRIWRDSYEAAVALGGDRGMGPMAAGHGAALLERALFDGLGRALDLPWHEILRRNLGGIDLGDVHPELAAAAPKDVLPPRPAGRLQVRHTVGAGDILREADLPRGNGPEGAAPEPLEASVRRQGLRHFRIELEGRPGADGDRLDSIAGVLARVEGLSVVLDGGEAFDDPADLQGLLDRLESGPEAWRRLYSAVAWVEQPFPRAGALDPDLCREVAALGARKPVFIDESDQTLGTFKRAAGLGYAGTTCRIGNGLTKALANLALCRLWNGAPQSGRRFLLAGAELLSLPVAGLHQHLAQMAALGVDPVECRGAWHQPGLGHLSPAEREACRQIHGGLYEVMSEDRASLAVRGGSLDAGSLNRAPGLGIGFPVDPSKWTPLSEWQPEPAGGAVAHA